MIVGGGVPENELKIRIPQMTATATIEYVGDDLWVLFAYSHLAFKVRDAHNVSWKKSSDHWTSALPRTPSPRSSFG
jgi:hypothetical protein